MSLSQHSRTGAIWFAGAALAGALLSSRACTRTSVAPPSDVDRVAQTYLQLVAELVRRDPDSASGDTATANGAADLDSKATPLAAIAAHAREAADILREDADMQQVDMVADRRAWLTAQLGALAARILGVPHVIATIHGWAFNEQVSLVSKVGRSFFSWLTALFCHRLIFVSSSSISA